MRLFVDDIRACPEGWTLARTITEAIRLLATTTVEEVSLDHDIFTDCCQRASWETFEPVARYIALMNPRPVIRFHTSNYPAGSKMAAILGLEWRWPAEEHDAPPRGD